METLNTYNVNQYNVVKNPIWQEADQLVIYKRSRGVELWNIKNNTSWWSERDLSPDFGISSPAP